MQPATDTDNPVKHDGHPPSSTPRLGLMEVFRRSEIRILHRGSVSTAFDQSEVIQTEWNDGPGLEASLNPDFDPPTFRVEPPRKDDASLEDVENVLAVRHGLVHVSASLVGVEFCEFVSQRCPCSLGRHTQGIHGRVQPTTESETRSSCTYGM